MAHPEAPLAGERTIAEYTEGELLFTNEVIAQICQSLRAEVKTRRMGNTDIYYLSSSPYNWRMVISERSNPKARVLGERTTVSFYGQPSLTIPSTFTMDDVHRVIVPPNPHMTIFEHTTPEHILQIGVLDTGTFFPSFHKKKK